MISMKAAGTRPDSPRTLARYLMMMMRRMMMTIYIYYDEVSVCHEKSSLPTSELSARGAK